MSKYDGSWGVVRMEFFIIRLASAKGNLGFRD